MNYSAFLALLCVVICGVGAQSKPAGLTFEVAAIRPSDPSSRRMSIEKTPDNGLRATSVSLGFLLQMGYGLEEFQISGGPSWIRSERFDINARAANPDATDLDLSDGPVAQLRAERLQERVRALVQERFQVRVRRESREGPVYILTQVKNGHRLGGPTGTRGMGRNRGLMTAESASVAMLTNSLSVALRRPVVDQTGLSGRYAFRLEWAEDGAPGEPEDSGQSLFTAIQEQLGLRLESGRAPIEYVVIDAAERPSAN